MNHDPRWFSRGKAFVGHVIWSIDRILGRRWKWLWKVKVVVAVVVDVVVAMVVEVAMVVVGVESGGGCGWSGCCGKW